jgi:hypothetical protein
MLSLALGRDDVDRRLARNAIGPVWDGNEVWLIVAAGATFAAFPVGYASMFSGFYLALFVVLVALIVRGVSFEFRGKRDSARWRVGWDRALALGSLVPAFAWGVAEPPGPRAPRPGPEARPGPAGRTGRTERFGQDAGRLHHAALRRPHRGSAEH